MATGERRQSTFRMATLPLTGDEMVDLIQNNKNRRTKLSTFLTAALQTASHIDGGTPYDAGDGTIDGGTP